MLVVNVKWYTPAEKLPAHEESVLIAFGNAVVTDAVFYSESEGELLFMNDCDQEWSVEEVQYWTPALVHPASGV